MQLFFFSVGSVFMLKRLMLANFINQTQTLNLPSHGLSEPC